MNMVRQLILVAVAPVALPMLVAQPRGLCDRRLRLCNALCTSLAHCRPLVSQLPTMVPLKKVPVAAESAPAATAGAEGAAAATAPVLAADESGVRLVRGWDSNTSGGFWHTALFRTGGEGLFWNAGQAAVCASMFCIALTTAA